jgi:hypothetical protein
MFPSNPNPRRIVTAKLQRESRVPQMSVPRETQLIQEFFYLFNGSSACRRSQIEFEQIV